MNTLAVVAGLIPGGARVAVDGPDGAGKTVFADRLAAVLPAPVVRISVDDFHHVRAVRYRRGRNSPSGFWLDSFDYARFRADVVEPFAPGGSRRYRPAAHDLATDAILNPPPRTAPPEAILLVDGLFLQRAELAGAWDLTIFLDVPFTETARRMSLRDGTAPDPTDPSVHRYVEAQRRYYAACNPQAQATILIDNANYNEPRIVRAPPERRARNDKPQR